MVAECLARSLASRSVINSKGLHVSITGESGKGKSHTVDTMLQQVPDELRLDGRMSDKALFYVEGLRPGSVIALDDISLSDQMQEILKGVTTSFQKPFRYRTVSKDRTGQVSLSTETRSNNTTENSRTYAAGPMQVSEVVALGGGEYDGW